MTVVVADTGSINYRAILFDLDGTLLDTLDDLADSGNAALRAMGLPEHPAEAYKLFIGDGVENLARRALAPERRDPAMVAECVGRYREEYRRRWADKTRPYDGISELLDALAARCVPMAVLSNKPDEFTQLCVARLLPKWRFAAVLGEGPSVPRKPDPTGACQIAARLGVAPEKILYVGDTATDMQTAVAAGMFPAGALWGFRTAEELLAHGARTLLAQPLDLLTRLDHPLESRL